MFKLRKGNKGLTVVLVLMTIFLVVLLANILLIVITSQSRLTHHKVSRIRAYYAAMAGINLAIDNLRRNTWQVNRNYCINCTSGIPPADRVNDNTLPYVVMINIGAVGADPPGPAQAIPGVAPITVKATYTYNPT